MPISRQEARSLMSRGYEMGATVLNGTVQREPDGAWTVDGKSVEKWLQTIQGQEVIVVAATVTEGRGKRQLCRVCGNEYEGYECPRCRQVRQRLRGRG